MNPNISVVMSVYNGEEYLPESIQSILNQTYINFEFIIIDDASTDNSWEILKSFSEKDNRLRLFRNEKNIGIEGFIKNLNFGCKKAQSKYIARIDQDDISRKDRLQLQFDFLESNPDIFIAGSAMRKIDVTGNIIGKMNAPLNDKTIRELMPKKISLYHPVIMFRKEYYETFYRDKIRYCEDYDFYLRIMTDSFKMANLEDYLLDYRILHNSMSRKQDKVIKNLFIDKVKDFYFERLEKGTDSYELFDPEEYLNIYQSTSKPLIRKAIFVSKKYYDFSGLEKMLDLYGTFSKDLFYFKNRLLLSAGKSFFYQYCKFI